MHGYKPKRVDTPAGPLHCDGPKTARAPEPFYPQSLERGRRSCRAVMRASAEMYVKGVSTRAVETILAAFGIEGLSSTQVSRATKRRDDDREAWRQRPLGRRRYGVLHARDEKPASTAAAMIAPSSAPSASTTTGAGAYGASRSKYRKPKQIGAPSSTALFHADFKALHSSRPMITQG
jgi:hypothetical protein